MTTSWDASGVELVFDEVRVKKGFAPVRAGLFVAIILAVAPTRGLCASSRAEFRCPDEFGALIETQGTLQEYDEAAWRTFFSDMETTENFDSLEKAEVAGLFAGMPAKLKEQVQAWIVRHYPQAKKWPRYGQKVAPKRGMDLILKLQLGAREFFASEIRAGRTPLQAYEAHLKRVGQVFSGSGYGGYSVGEVMEVARAVQAEIRAAKTTGDSPGVILAGSFPNGKARSGKSDIDLVMSPFNGIAPVQKKTESKVNEALAGKLAFAVEQHYISLPPPSAAGARDARAIRNEAEHFWGHFESVTLFITSEHIELRVYPGPVVYPLE